jgi:hypothetical protein
MFQQLFDDQKSKCSHKTSLETLFSERYERQTWLHSARMILKNSLYTLPDRDSSHFYLRNFRIVHFILLNLAVATGRQVILIWAYLAVGGGQLGHDGILREKGIQTTHLAEQLSPQLKWNKDAQ